jgi:hypothetical protein
MLDQKNTDLEWLNLKYNQVLLNKIIHLISIDNQAIYRIKHLPGSAVVEH